MRDHLGATSVDWDMLVGISHLPQAWTLTW